MAKLMSFVVLVAMVVATSVACDGGPTGPSNICTDPKASNFEGPLPCEYPAPTVSSVRMTVFPVEGRVYPYGFVIPVSLAYEIAGNPVGVKVYSCLSLDGETPLVGKLRVVSEARGGVDLVIGLSSDNSHIAETNWILNWLEAPDGTILAKEKLARTIRYGK